MGETMQDAYVRHRLDGMGARDAAEAAGFSGGVPSPGARRLWEAAQLARMIKCDVGIIDLRIEEHRKRLRDALRLKRACRLMGSLHA